MDDVMDDPELSTLLHDAVADVEPTDRLAEIRERTLAAPRAVRLVRRRRRRCSPSRPP